MAAALPDGAGAQIAQDQAKIGEKVSDRKPKISGDPARHTSSIDAAEHIDTAMPEGKANKSSKMGTQGRQNAIADSSVESSMAGMGTDKTETDNETRGYENPANDTGLASMACGGDRWKQALQSGDMRLLDALLSSGHFEDLETRDEGGQTALRLASERGQVRVVERLLAAGADADSKDLYGVTALLMASRGGHARVIDLLLSSGGCRELEATDWSRYTALYVASSGGYACVVERLLAAGADASVASRTGVTTLCAALQHHHLPVVELLLSSGRCGDLDAKDQYGKRALHLASQHGYTSVVERLIAAGVDTEAKNKPGWTALFLAAREGHLPVVDVLLSSGRYGDINATDVSGTTSLYWASANGHAGVVERLLSSGADAALKLRSGLSPLLVASKAGSLAVVELLLSSCRCGDLDITDEDYQTALHIASGRGHTSVVERLLYAGVNTEAMNRGGMTALQVARRQGLTAIANLLEEVTDIGLLHFRANRLWGCRKVVTMWRVARNYDH